jgi:sodium/hydrogen antiporter
LVIRPLATHLCLIGTPTTLLQRSLMGWFGIRGIGSLYYLAYAFAHGVAAGAAAGLADLTLSVVATSIVIHGATSQPLMHGMRNETRADDRVQVRRRHLKRSYSERPHNL